MYFSKKPYLLACAMAVLQPGLSLAQDFPVKPVRIDIANPAGVDCSCLRGGQVA